MRHVSSGVCGRAALKPCAPAAHKRFTMTKLSTAQIAVICVCTMNGPGLVTLPGAFAKGGVVATLMLLLFVASATVFTHACNAMMASRFCNAWLAT